MCGSQTKAFQAADLPIVAAVSALSLFGNDDYDAVDIALAPSYLSD